MNCQSLRSDEHQDSSLLIINSVFMFCWTLPSLRSTATNYKLALMKEKGLCIQFLSYNNNNTTSLSVHRDLWFTQGNFWFVDILFLTLWLSAVKQKKSMNDLSCFTPGTRRFSCVVSVFKTLCPSRHTSPPQRVGQDSCEWASPLPGSQCNWFATQIKPQTMLKQ